MNFCAHSARILNTKYKGKTLLVKPNQIFWAETFVWFDQQCFAFTLCFQLKPKFKRWKLLAGILTIFLKSLGLYPFDARITKICKKLKSHNSFFTSKMGLQLIFSILVCPHKAIVGFQFLVYFQNPWIKWAWKRFSIVVKYQFFWYSLKP